jgi:hypothetical protein
MPGTGAQGFVGIAPEAVAGTYVAPTKYVPVESESLQYMQDTIFRRPVRQTADVVGAVDGNAHVEGDMSMEAFEDVVALMLHSARTTRTKTGTTPNFTYALVGSAVAVPAKTMSITVIRNGIVFGYTGCIIGNFSFTIEDGILKFNCGIVGRDETSQALPTATWNTGVQATPYGAGKYNLQIPTTTQVFDADGFEFNVDDSAEPQYRLKDTSRGAQFIQYGERTVTMSMERDFDTRTDYDAFKALTAQDITLLASKGANNSITIQVPAAIKDTYEVGLGGQGDLTRAQIAYNGVLDAVGNAYKVTVKTQEDIT